MKLFKLASIFTAYFFNSFEDALKTFNKIQRLTSPFVILKIFYESLNLLKVLPWQNAAFRMPFFCDLIIVPYSFTTKIAFSCLVFLPYCLNVIDFLQWFDKFILTSYFIFSFLFPFLSVLTKTKILILICSLMLDNIKSESNLKKQTLNDFS